jgi:FtsP/CotA-like multicopper oxidase with cupredoxin domain
MQRREILKALAAAPLTYFPASHGQSVSPPALRAAPAVVRAAGQAALPVWAYGGEIPGPVLRYKRGDVVDLELDNALPEATTIHWHGMRLPNAMDGVPHLTQLPVEPGQRFRYRYALPDAGTFWYHPHLGTAEQVERGLAGVLVVEDDEPPAADLDVAWLLDDWRLDSEGRVAEDFYNFMDVSHAGRLGQLLTVNGQLQPSLPLQTGQRLRLRLVNAANARILALELRGMRAWLIARDAVPADEAIAWEGPLILGPGMRADVIVDTDVAGEFFLVDRFGRGERTLGSLNVSGRSTTASRPSPQPAKRAPLPEPVLAGASEQTLMFGGGMMSMQGWPKDPWTDRVARKLRRLGGAREADPVWTVNGEAHMGQHDAHAPVFSVPVGRSVLVTLQNPTAFWHPIHLHGHHVKVLARNGQKLDTPSWRDTVLLAPRDSLELAFVADNPGNWLVHCHVLEHHAGGMGAVFAVT